MNTLGQFLFPLKNKPIFTPIGTDLSKLTEQEQIQLLSDINASLESARQWSCSLSDSYKIYDDLAQKGVPAAWMPLVKILLEGRHPVQKDEARAFRLCQLAINFSDSAIQENAYLWLGKMHREGLGVPKDEQQAEQHYGKAYEIASDKDEVILVIAKEYYASKEDQAAVKWLMKATELNKSGSMGTVQSFLHQMHQEGRGDISTASYERGRDLLYSIDWTNDPDNVKKYHCAIQWLMKAEHLGSQNAKHELTRQAQLRKELVRWDMRTFGLSFLGDCSKPSPDSLTEEFDSRRRKEDLPLAIYWLERAANLGAPGVAYHLGIAYGDFQECQDFEKATEWFRYAAEKESDVSAMFSLALGYQRGDYGLPKDNQQAVHYYLRAIDGDSGIRKDKLKEICRIDKEGSSKTIYEHGRQHLKTGNEQKAIEWFTEAAALDNVEAMLELGLIHQKNGEFQSFIERFAQAANPGNVDVQRFLGVIYEKELQPPNYVAAATWYSEAASHGDAVAAEKLATICLEKKVDNPGLYIGKMCKEGLHYLNDKGNSSNSVTDNAAKAYALLSQVARIATRADVFLHLGEMCLTGRGTKLDYPRAIEAYMSAVDCRDLDGIEKLNEMHQNRQGNVAEAMYQRGIVRSGLVEGERYTSKQQLMSGAAGYWFEQAAGLGHQKAAYSAGRIHHLQNNFKAALEWYLKASDDSNAVRQIESIVTLGQCKNPNVMFKLASCCARGTGVSPDLEKAMNYVDRGIKLLTGVEQAVKTNMKRDLQEAIKKEFEAQQREASAKQKQKESEEKGWKAQPKSKELEHEESCNLM